LIRHSPRISIILAGILVVILAGLVLALAGCVQGLPREPVNPTPLVVTATPEPTREPDPTATPEPTPTLVPTPTLPPTATPPPTSTPVPTPVPGLLEVQGPEDGTVVVNNVAVVYGNTRPGATVTVNGEPAIVEVDGRFQAGLLLTVGANEIEVVATDADGQTTTRAIRRVTLQSRQPLFLSISEPQDQTVTQEPEIIVAGLTTPDAVITIRGRRVPVQVREVNELPIKELGVFTTLVVLTPGPNIIEVVATNSVGQVLPLLIAVTYLVP